MKFDPKQLGFSLAMIVGTVVLLELALAVLASISSKVGSVVGSTPSTIYDERLGYRPNPDLFGHDRNGFRNPAVPERADLVALGDSQTYGTGVLPAHAWPMQLASLTGWTIYSMAFGGYGPVHSLALMEDALELQPETIVEAFYAGNDLFDAFNRVYSNGRQSELKSTDPGVLAAVQRREAAESISERVNQLFDGGDGTPRFSPLAFVLEHSMLLGLIDAFAVEVGDGLRATPVLGSVWNAVEWRLSRRAANAEPGGSELFDDGRYKTIFTPEYRMTGMDLDDPRIAEGHRICLESIRRMKEIASNRDIDFLVLLIPTKELVFKKISVAPSAAYRALVTNEEEMWRRSTRFFETHHIRVVDALPALRDELASGTQPYPMSDSGHPTRDGQAAIARLVAAELAN